MELWEAIQSRHSVRQYLPKPLTAEQIEALEDEIDACNRESGLRIQLITESPGAFDSRMARYGKFSGVRNYIAMVGRKGPDLEEKLGWYGERIVLRAQQLGLNTCWVALTFSKRKARALVCSDEKMVCVIAIGWGVNHGVPHANKPLEKLCRVDGPMPDWFRRGMIAARLAPTAVNQQHFRFTLHAPRTVEAVSTGGFYSKVDLGIVKYHFAVGAGQDQFDWAPQTK